MVLKACSRAGMLLLVVAILVGNTNAAGPSLRLDPLLLERALKPGETLNYTVNVENGDRFNSLPLVIAVADVEEDLYGIYRLRAPGSTSHSLAKWVRLETDKVVLPPGGYKEIGVTVSIPKGESGGKYGAVVVSMVPDEQAMEQGALGESLYVFQTASFLELVLTGTVGRREAYVSSFDVRRSAEFPSLQREVGDHALVYTAAVSNEGNIHIATRGSLTIKTRDGKTIGRYPLGGGRGTILPGSTVALQSVITKPLPPGDYTARAMVEYGGHRPLVANVDFAASTEEVSSKGSAQVGELSRFLIEPSQVELTMRAGAFKTLLLEITNRGHEIVDLQASILPLAFDIYGDMIPEEDRGEAVPWIEVSPKSFTLEPGEMRRVRLSARPPREANGGYYADVLFRSKDTDGEIEAGANFCIFVGDSPQRKGSLTMSDPELSSSGLQLDLEFTNEGSIHVEPSVELLLSQVFPQLEAEDGRVFAAHTEEIASLGVPAGANPVLPGGKRIFGFLIPNAFEPGEYELAVRVDFGGDEPAVVQTKFAVDEGRGSIE